jgi:hypothetical protein
VLAAELLLSRARYGQTIHRLADAEQAAALAIRARNARRTWQGDSVAAVLVAVKAAALSGNYARAWALIQCPPGGEATEAEAADLRLRREAARLAALTGRFEQAHASAKDAGNPFAEAEVTALELTADGKTSKAITAWEAALRVAVADALAAAMSLAELGAPVPPWPVDPRSPGRLKGELLTVAEATLLFNYYADLGFDRAAVDFAARMERWRPRGAAFAVTRPATWTEPAAVVEFVFTAVEQPAAAALDDLEGWVTAAALGLVRIAPDEDAAGTNLQVLLGQCLAQPWMRPDRLPAVLRAVRVAQKERPGTTDPVEPVLAETFRTLVARHGHALAAPLLMSLVGFASEPERFTAARLVLTHED